MFISIEIVETGYIVTVSETNTFGGLDLGSIVKKILPGGGDPLQEAIENANNIDPLKPFFGRHVFEKQADLVVWMNDLTMIQRKQK